MLDAKSCEAGWSAELHTQQRFGELAVEVPQGGQIELALVDSPNPHGRYEVTAHPGRGRSGLSGRFNFYDLVEELSVDETVQVRGFVLSIDRQVDLHVHV